MAAEGLLTVRVLFSLPPPLSFEHVPPRKAFNERRVFHANARWMLEQARTIEEFRNPPGSYAQKGAGGQPHAARSTGEFAIPCGLQSQRSDRGRRSAQQQHLSAGLAEAKSSSSSRATPPLGVLDRKHQIGW